MEMKGKIGKLAIKVVNKSTNIMVRNNKSNDHHNYNDYFNITKSVYRGIKKSRDFR